MKTSYIDYSETHCFSPAIIRYLENDPSLASFSSFSPDIAGFRELINSKKNKPNRSILKQVLNKQYEKLPEVHSAVQNNISLLSEDSTYTVTTGHQLNLFTGPLYFIFKIVSAINLAKELKASFPKKNFVPVYWMASEDHDFPEINHTYIAGKKISWDREAAGGTGRLMTRGIEQTLREYISTLGISANAEQLGNLMTLAYNGSANLADATRYMVNSLFQEYGLVILDADEPLLKKEFAAIMTNDIIQQNSFRNISEASIQLERQGIDVQVNPREINFFYLIDGLRQRLVFEENEYKVLDCDISFTEDELKEEIKNVPERFSPNVVMRPLYQEFILPNLAYIGGGAEIVYWLQLKKNFDFYDVDFPILLLRNSALIIPGSVSSKISRTGLSTIDIFRTAEELKKEWVVRHSAHTLNLHDEWNELNAVFDKIKLRAHKVDPSLAPSTEAVKARLHKAIANLEKKLIKAEKRNYSDVLSQIDKFKDKLFPGGGLQERKENFGSFYLSYGKDFIPMLIRNFRPLDLKFTILEE